MRCGTGTGLRRTRAGCRRVLQITAAALACSRWHGRSGRRSCRRRSCRRRIGRRRVRAHRRRLRAHGRRPGARRRSALLLPAGNSERRHRSAIELSRCLETLLPLERNQGLSGARSKHAIRLAHVEALLNQRDLHLPDVLHAYVRADGDRASLAGAKLGARGAHWHDGKDPMAVIHNDDFVAHDEIHIATPFGVDLDQGLWNLDDAHGCRDNGPNSKREVHTVNARHVTARENRLLNSHALLGCQIDSSTGLGALPGLRLASLSLAGLCSSFVRLRLTRLRLARLAALALSRGLRRLGMRRLSLTGTLLRLAARLLGLAGGAISFVRALPSRLALLPHALTGRLATLARALGARLVALVCS